jgi:hypothetical protein
LSHFLRILSENARMKLPKVSGTSWCRLSLLSGMKVFDLEFNKSLINKVFEVEVKKSRKPHGESPKKRTLSGTTIIPDNCNKTALTVGYARQFGDLDAFCPACWTIRKALIVRYFLTCKSKSM